MHTWLCKLVTLVLLLALPLQGLSAVLMPFHCLTGDQHASTSAAAGPQHHGESVTHEHDATTAATALHHGSPSSNEAGHFCCHHVYTGAPSVAVLPAPDMPFVFVDQVATAPPLFFPEQLLRPPRP